MSTEIKDVMVKDDSVTIEAIGDRVELVAYDNAAMTDVLTSRADFLAAVAKECDVIVVDRAELPKVERVSRGDRSFSVGDPDGVTTHTAATAKYARERGMGYLAIAEYLDAHPPVDEAQVEALAGMLEREDRGARPFNEDLARRLLATGRIEVKP